MPDIPKIPRKDIEGKALHYYRRSGGTRPDLYSFRFGNEILVVKDFAHSDFWFRILIGPILIRREFGALKNLIGIKGVPQLRGKVDRYAIVMEHIDGKNLSEVESGTLKNDFYDSFSKVVCDIHSRGVAHCDLRSRGNIIVGNDGHAYIIDFAACVYKGRGINPFTRLIFREFSRADRNAVLLNKKRLSEELLTDEEKKELEKPLPFEKPAKLIGENIRKLIRFLLTRKK